LRESQQLLVAFSNGTTKTVNQILSAAQLAGYFSQIISVDQLRTFKPSPAVYAYLTRSVAADAKSVWLISSNAWDVIGAKSAGLRAIWVQLIRISYLIRGVSSQTQSQRISRNVRGFLPNWTAAAVGRSWGRGYLRTLPVTTAILRFCSESTIRIASRLSLVSSFLALMTHQVCGSLITRWLSLKEARSHSRNSEVETK
jgi:hypothetical protein